MEAFYSFATYFELDAYVTLEGTFYVAYGSKKYHASLSIAKRYCSKNANCFGVMDHDDKSQYSIEFPIELRQYGYSYVHKKENVSGNFHLSMIVRLDNSNKIIV